MKKDELDGKIRLKKIHGAHAIGKKLRFVNMGMRKM
jgi:hypothetical protein